MQVFKKFIYIFMLTALFGCTTDSSVKKIDAPIIADTKISESTFGQATNFRVGMLIPLTGSASKQGEGLRNAALLALEDVNNPNILIQFYDTKSTASGSRIAIENALNQQSQMIIGPLMAEEVKAISATTLQKNIPVVTFSTSYDAILQGVYSLGLLTGEQVDRVISYSASKNRQNIALLVPDNNTGISVAKASIISAQKNDMNVVRIGFYPPNTTNFSDILKDVTDYDKRSQRVKNIKAKLQKQADSGSQTSARILGRLKGIDTLGDVDFDTILIPESGQRLKAATAMLSFYDASYPKVQILGTSIWATSDLSREGSLQGAWYPAIANNNEQYFIKKYKNTFDESPNSLYSFGYDAIALASIISTKKDIPISDVITNSEGYIGINGIFRIFADGTNQHALDIVQIGQNELKTIDKAPAKFSGAVEYTDFVNIKYDSSYKAPLIFGKDRILAQTLIYSSELPPENQHESSELSGAQEAELIRAGLARYKIVIP